MASNRYIDPFEQQMSGDDCGTCDILGAVKKGTKSKFPNLRSSSTSKSPSTQTSSSSTLFSPQFSSDDTFWTPRPAPGIVEIGNAGWSTIHSFAAYYPDNPTPKQQESAKNFINAFGDLFPCDWCAEDLREHLRKNPVDVSSRKAFSKWTCDAHNHVNAQLGKPDFDCSLFDVFWRRLAPK